MENLDLDDEVSKALQAKAAGGNYTSVFNMVDRNPQLVIATIKEITGLNPEIEKKEVHETLGRVMVGHAQKKVQESIPKPVPEASANSE